MKIGKFVIDGNAAIMGILNVTPDSFSDGGSYTTVQKALQQVDQLIAGGVKLLMLAVNPLDQVTNL